MEKQLIGILETVQEITPEIASQAVAYWRLVNVAWIGVALLIAAFAARICFWCKKHWGERDYIPPAIFFGFVFIISSMVVVNVTIDLIGSYIAPDYYAAKAVIHMFHLGVH